MNLKNMRKKQKIEYKMRCEMKKTVVKNSQKVWFIGLELFHFLEPADLTKLQNRELNFLPPKNVTQFRGAQAISNCKFPGHYCKVADTQKLLGKKTW